MSSTSAFMSFAEDIFIKRTDELNEVLSGKDLCLLSKKLEVGNRTDKTIHIRKQPLISNILDLLSPIKKIILH